MSLPRIGQRMAWHDGPNSHGRTWQNSEGTRRAGRKLKRSSGCMRPPTEACRRPAKSPFANKRSTENRVEQVSARGSRSSSRDATQTDCRQQQELERLQLAHTRFAKKGKARETQRARRLTCAGSSERSAPACRLLGLDRACTQGDSASGPPTTRAPRPALAQSRRT